MRVAVVVAAAGLALAAGAAAPAPVGAVDGAVPVAYVQASPAASAARGLIGGQEVGIWASIHETRGAISSDPIDWPFFDGVVATVERTSGGPHQSVTFELKTTSVPDAFYGGRRVASTWAGTWTVTKLTWFVAGVGVTSVDPQVMPVAGAARTFTVVGTDVPTVSSIRIPQVAAYGARQWVQYTVRTSAGAPATGLPVRFASRSVCLLPQLRVSGGPGPSTDANGRVTIPLGRSSTETCVDVWSRPIWTSSPETAGVLARLTPTRYEYYRWVSALPTVAAVRVNRLVTVIGSAAPNRGEVRLQRLVGRTWRTVASAQIRTSGRYTVSGLVTTLGRNYFRVVALNGASTLAPTTSPVVLVIGTRR